MSLRYARTSVKRGVLMAKETYGIAKETYVIAKETNGRAKEVYEHDKSALLIS